MDKLTIESNETLARRVREGYRPAAIVIHDWSVDQYLERIALLDSFGVDVRTVLTEGFVETRREITFRQKVEKGDDPTDSDVFDSISGQVYRVRRFDRRTRRAVE